MLNSKQRAQLRGMANALDTTLQIGKSGVTDSVIRQADDALTARELVKGRVLDNSPLSAGEAAEELAAAAQADVVQTIGSRFVLYRENRTIEKDKRIKLRL